MIMDTIRNSKDYMFTPFGVKERIEQTIFITVDSWTIGPGSKTAEDDATRKGGA